MPEHAFETCRAVLCVVDVPPRQTTNQRTAAIVRRFVVIVQHATKHANGQTHTHKHTRHTRVDQNCVCVGGWLLGWVVPWRWVVDLCVCVGADLLLRLSIV